MNSPRSAPPYPELAVKIAAGRAALGLSQTALAAELGLKQQAVSRWEAGTHRPSVDQIPTLAALIKQDTSALMVLAGYGQPLTSTLSALFPVDALAPDTFERFVETVLHDLHPEADVNILGSRGHDQKGADILVRFPDGPVWAIQCKRVERFGAADIEKAVAALTIEADRKFLVLSKIASPAAIEALASHAGWSLWDKQVLTREVRSLSAEAQERLVDIYFRGQRMALLGRSEPGPWMTADEYFAPFQGRGAIFTHDWPLVGRDQDLDRLVEALDDDTQRSTLLLGPGGIGKTRILKEAVNRFAAKNSGIIIRFLSASQEPGAANLAALGTGRKLLIIDDAHDRDGLKLLIEHAVFEGNQTKLLIASRPYAEQRIRNDLALYGIVDPSTIVLDRLGKEALRQLVLDVLNQFGGTPNWAEPILAYASDSPLIAAMAARVVATEEKIPELARSDPKLRRLVLSRFTNVITGHLSAPADAPLLRAVLEVLALIQPFHIDDRRIGELVDNARPGIAPQDVSRALKLLVEGGVLYKRGPLHRLMPDLLGDFLIEEACIGADGQLTDFALGVANMVESDRLSQVLVNLGRTDWRLADGTPSNSKLLEPIWKSLRAIDNKYDGRITAIEAVAYYQPSQALAFVQAQIEAGRILQAFGGILQKVAYSVEHRTDALRLLWDLGQLDDRDTNSHMSHPIRILADLVGYDRYKPVSFNEDVASFAFSLLDLPGVWAGRHTPFDVLKPLLKGEGMTTRSNGKSISLSPFFVEYDVVADLRARLIDRVIGLLESDNLRAALHAALVVEDTVRPPYGMMGEATPDELRAKYEKEFAKTIARIDILIAKGTLAPTTIVGLIRSLDWYAQYGTGPLRDQVSDLFQRLPLDLNFRLYATIVDRAEWVFVGQMPFASWDDEKDWLPAFVTELLSVYPSRDTLCDVLVEHLDTAQSAGMPIGSSGYLIDKLIAADPIIGAIIIERSLVDSSSRWRNYLGYAVGHLLENRADEGRATIARMLESSQQQIRTGAVRGLIALRRPYEQADLNLLEAGLSSADQAVVSVAITVLRSWHIASLRDIIPLILGVNFGKNDDLLEGLASILCHDLKTTLHEMHADEVAVLLDRMKQVPRLKGYWTAELLKRLGQQHGLAVAGFVLARADLALAKEDEEGYRAVGYGPRGDGLALERSPDISEILERVWLWLRDHDSVRGARYSIGMAVSAMLQLDSPPVVEFLDTMLDRATVGDLEWCGLILRHAPHSFALEHRRFVERYLTRCKEVEQRLIETAIDQLSAAAMSGSWSGISGEPMPRDVEVRDKTTAILSSMSRLSPAYPLYQEILNSAKRNINRSFAEAAALEDED